jgi:hypothetical protein
MSAVGPIASFRGDSATVAFGGRIQPIDATPFPSDLARWIGLHMEGHARTWSTPKQTAELWERWKSGQWVADVARALEEGERCLRSWLSMEELLQRQAGEFRRVVLRRPVELTGG